jgi:hypothetical protein
MIWARMLAYITGTVDQDLLLRNGYLAAENRILRAQIKSRLVLSDAGKATLAKIAHGSDGKPWKNCRLSRSRIRCWPGTESSSAPVMLPLQRCNGHTATKIERAKWWNGN